MTKVVGRSVGLLVFLLAYGRSGYAGTTGNGAPAQGANPANVPSAAANSDGGVPPSPTAPGQNGAGAAAGGITLKAIPLGAVTATGGGHYSPLPIVTKGGERTLVVVAKGSRVEAYLDGQAGPAVNAIPETQSLPLSGIAGSGTRGSPQFSADLKRVAYVVKLDNAQSAVVVDATMSPAYATLDPTNLFFAPVGHHFAYVAGKPSASGPGQFVVDDGKAGLIYQGIGAEGFSPDGKHFAYVASTASRGLTPLEVQAGKKWAQNVCVVLDGVEQNHFAKIERPLFSQDSQHLAYLAGIDQLSLTRAVVDGREGPAYVHVEQLAISDDGSRSAYVATKATASATGSASCAVVDNGKEGPSYVAIKYLCVSHDGGRAAYVATTAQNATLVVDNDKVSPQYRACESLKISPDGKTTLAIVTASQGTFVVANGQEYGPFTQAFVPAFSQEGGHWACCVGVASGGYALLADGKTIALKGVAPGTVSYQEGTGQLVLKSTTSNSGVPVAIEVKGDAINGADLPSAIAYSPNRQHMAKVFTTGFGTSGVKQKIAIDDQPPSAADYAGIQNVAVSDDGKHAAFIGSYIGENGKPLIHAIYDGTEGPGYFSIKDLALSPDGKHVAYVAEKNNGHGIDTYVVVDGMEGPTLQDALIDGMFTGQGIGANDEFRQVRFEADGSLHFFPVMNGQLYRAWYPAGSFNGLPSLAAHEGEKPGPRDVHNFVRPNVFSDPATAMHFVLAPDETIYGISEADGKFKKGTLFKVKTDGSGFVVLHDFYGGDDDGEKPMSLMLAADGSLIGTLERKVFRYEPKSQKYELLNVDTKGNPGPSLLAGIAGDGAIVGFGGMYGNETSAVVSMAPDGSNFTRLENGQSGKPLLQYAQIVAGKDGTFFAISTAQGSGSVVKFKSLKDTPTLVHKFVASPTDGSRPEANLVMDNKGNLYGSTAAGGMSQHGVIYKISADGANYQVVYNPDEFKFSKTFVPGDDGMLYGISAEGLLQLAPDGSGKPPTTLVAFDGGAYSMYRGATPNIFYHDGAVYGLHNKAIYKVTLPRGGSGTAGATPTVAIQTVQPAVLAGEAIAFTEPPGAASAGSAAGPAAGIAPTSAQPPGQVVPQAQPPLGSPSPQRPANSPGNALKKADDAAKSLRGLLGH